MNFPRMMRGVRCPSRDCCGNLDSPSPKCENPFHSPPPVPCGFPMWEVLVLLSAEDF